jgi:Pathogenicity locus
MASEPSLALSVALKPATKQSNSKSSGTTARTSRKPAAKKSPRLRSPLQIIPGVGPAAVGDFHRLGITEVAHLKGRDPQTLYDTLAELDGKPHDRCVLYVFRAAVYYASTTRHDPEKLKWWNWKDVPPRKAR